MCSLSLFAHGSQRILTMNRDEAKARPELGSLNHIEGPSTHIAYPVDLQSGGSWIAANAHGVALALLNRYHEPALALASSRGGIIPALIQHGAFEHVLARAQAQTWARYSPFDLVLVAADQLALLQWNGYTASWRTAIESDTARAFFISSSAERTESVIAYRQQRFDEFVLAQLPLSEDAQRASLHILGGLHLQQQTETACSDILVDRPYTHTKSICQVVLGQSQTQMRYWNAQALLALDRAHPTLPEHTQSWPRETFQKT
jgi:uncharacterized protein with NRDE domain